MTNYIMLFQPKEIPFLSVPSDVFNGSLLVALNIGGSEKSRFVDKMRMQTWRMEMDRVTADAQSGHYCI